MSFHLHINVSQQLQFMYLHSTYFWQMVKTISLYDQRAIELVFVSTFVNSEHLCVVLEQSCCECVFLPHGHSNLVIHLINPLNGVTNPVCGGTSEGNIVQKVDSVQLRHVDCQHMSV